MGSETLDMTSQGFVEMFEGVFADTCANKVGKQTRQACAEGERFINPNAEINLAQAMLGSAYLTLYSVDILIF